MRVETSRRGLLKNLFSLHDRRIHIKEQVNEEISYPSKEPLDEEENEKAGLKLNIQKTKIVVSGPITSWQIDGETVPDFIFWAPKSLHMVIAGMKLKDAYSLEEKLSPT